MRISLFLFLIIVSVTTIAQTQPTENDLKKEIIINDERFRVYNNWVNIGGGVSKISSLENSYFTLGIGYNFHIKAHYFQLGTDVQGKGLGDYMNTELHFCYGKRKETPKFNLSYFAGISYSQGYKPKDSLFVFFRAPGIHVCAQYIKKIKYDLGIGPGVFADINQSRMIFGARIDLYFSSAFKGRKK